MSESVESTPKPSRRKSDQDQEIADFNIASAQYLDTIADDAEITALLEGRGYGTVRLTAGRTLQTTLQTTITHRQTMIGEQGAAGSSLIGAADDSRQAFADYRETVKSIVAFTAADRKTLGAGGIVFRDKQKFINQATSAYDNAALPAYAATLAEFGYSAEALAAARATLDAYSKADTDQNSVGGDATKATADRNAAYQALKAYMKQLKGIAKVALRKRPDLLKKLNP